MTSKLKYKISSNRDKVYLTKDEAFNAAVVACRRQKEPQVLMGFRASGTVREWEVICTERLYFEFDRNKGGLLTIVDAKFET